MNCNLDCKKLKQTVYDNRKMILILLVIFILAVSIRSNIVRYEGNYLFEPDAYYHARLIQDLVQDGYVPEFDEDVYYQLGGMTHQPPSAYHYISAFLYIIISFGVYNKELLAFSVQFFPVIFGALISIGMYFLGKEIFNDKKIGLISGFLTAVTPAFAYRTMAGAQGDNSLGFLWMVIGFLFLVRALKTKSLNKQDLINVILSGAFFATMVFTWRMHLLIPMILVPSAGFMLLYIAGTEKKETDLKKSVVTNFIIKIGIALGIYTLATIIYNSGNEFWVNGALTYLNQAIPLGDITFIILGIIATAAVIGLAYFFNTSKKEIKEIAPTLVILGLYVGLIAMLFFFAIVPDLVDRTTIGSMVGEENTGRQFFGTKYNALIIFPWIAIAAFPITLWLFKHKKDPGQATQIIFWFWTIITLFMAWYKLKFTFVFGLGIVTGGVLVAYMTFELLKKYEKEKGIEAKTTLFALLAIIVLGVGSAGLFMPDYQPQANSNPVWIGTTNWIIENTSEDAKFFNWWGEGHLLAFLTERKFSSDNRNASPEANKLYAEFNITEDVNRGYEIAKNEIGAEYILLQGTNFYSGTTYEFYVNDKVDYSLGRLYNLGRGSAVIGCSKVEQGMNCNGQLIPQTEFEKIANNWKSTPDSFHNGSEPEYFYRTDDRVIILNNKWNGTNLAKIYFNSTETKEMYEEVYYNNGLKIFKVK